MSAAAGQKEMSLPWRFSFDLSTHSFLPPLTAEKTSQAEIGARKGEALSLPVVPRAGASGKLMMLAVLHFEQCCLAREVGARVLLV